MKTPHTTAFSNAHIVALPVPTVGEYFEHKLQTMKTKVQITNLAPVNSREETTSYVADSEYDCRDSTDRFAYRCAVEYQNCVCVGLTVAELLGDSKTENYDGPGCPDDDGRDPEYPADKP